MSSRKRNERRDGPYRIVRTMAARLASGLLRDRRGVAAVEFALVLPFMLVLFLGVTELNSALTLDRKVSQAASSVADLVAQADKLTSSEVNDLLQLSRAVLDPYPEAPLSMVVASVWIKDVNQPRVVWSRAMNTSQWGAGSAPPIELPPELTQQKDTYLVVAHAEYEHRPTFAAVLKDVFNKATITLSDTYYLRPRVSTSVACCN
ncbi:TadE/TadG family type IV pilus assembly protein [Stappia sp. P2PMeth1]|uniref:TadE/TadG family type IV pilus assembly protein n=1 Tax=Stappia sp. P2PMeth1 TaxID=2003586 RepID=UPI001646723C|nr:TadE/TadG family type IV pilus assembly protein [Stappia sp. P2PMeth1]